MSNAPQAPRASSYAPWNALTIQRTVNIANSTAFTITPTYLRDTLISQLGLVAGTTALTTTFNIRPISIEVHDMAGRPFTLAIRDFSSVQASTTTALPTVGTGISYPSRSGYSRVRLTWPKVISANPLRVTSTANATVIVSGSTGIPSGNTIITGTAVLLKISVLWRTGEVDTVSAIEPATTLLAHPFRSDGLVSMHPQQFDIAERVDDTDM